MTVTDKQASISYGGFDFKFDGNLTDAYPVPTVTWGLTRNRTAAGELLSDEINVTLDGVVRISGGGDGNVETLMNKATNLQTEIYNNDGGPFIFSFDNVNMVTGFAIIKSFEFSENDNYWTNTVDYSLELAIAVSGTGSYLTNGNSSTHHITSCEDSYSLSETEETYPDPNNYDSYYHIYKLTRNISATAKGYANNTSGALLFAKQWVRDREVNFPLTETFDSNDFQLFDQKRKVDFSEADGKYTINDTFTVKDGVPWIYKNTINAGYESSNFLRTISIEGEVQGLEPATGIYKPYIKAGSPSGQLDLRIPTPLEEYTKGDKSDAHGKSALNTTKYENALSGYYKMVRSNEFFDQALSYDSFSKDLITDNFTAGSFSNYKSRPLHPIPFSIVEGLDPSNGKVTFTRTFNSRPTGLLRGTLFESLNISDNKPKSLMTPLPVLGRRLGPLYWNPQGRGLGNFVSGVGSRTVTFEAFFPRETHLPNYKFPIEEINKIDTYLKLYAPPSTYASFIKEDSQDLSLTDNKLTKTITWEYIKCNPTS